MKELEYLRDRSLLIINFILSKDPGDPIMEYTKTVVEQTYSKQNLKGLKMLSRDMNACAKGLSREDIKELEILLADKFGENLSGDKITHAVIKQVLKKGKIESKENYRVVYEYLQDISDSDPFYSKFSELESMLEIYPD